MSRKIHQLRQVRSPDYADDSLQAKRAMEAGTDARADIRYAGAAYLRRSYHFGELR